MTANANAFNTFKNMILPQCTAEIIFLQETKLTGKSTPEGDTDMDRARATLDKQGYKAAFVAATDTDKGGGGVVRSRYRLEKRQISQVPA
jgi:exonuclease III